MVEAVEEGCQVSPVEVEKRLEKDGRQELEASGKSATALLVKDTGRGLALRGDKGVCGRREGETAE